MTAIMIYHIHSKYTAVGEHLCPCKWTNWSFSRLLQVAKRLSCFSGSMLSLNCWRCSSIPALFLPPPLVTRSVLTPPITCDPRDSHRCYHFRDSGLLPLTRDLLLQRTHVSSSTALSDFNLPKMAHHCHFGYVIFLVPSSWKPLQQLTWIKVTTHMLFILLWRVILRSHCYVQRLRRF